MEVFLSKNIFVNEFDTEILVRIENYEEGTVYYWTTETFYNRYNLMKEQFDKYLDEDLDLNGIKREEDPLWDDALPKLMGYSFYKLKPLAFLMNNPSSLSIISPNGNKIASLEIDIIPTDEEGKILDKDPPDDPMELIGNPLNYKVFIKDAKDLFENFCKDVFVEYTSFYDSGIYRTKVVNGKNKNPIFNEYFENRIDYLTKDEIELLMKGKMEFRVFSYEEVVKKGKTLLEPRTSTLDLLNHNKFSFKANPFNNLTSPMKSSPSKRNDEKKKENIDRDFSLNKTNANNEVKSPQKQSGNSKTTDIKANPSNSSSGNKNNNNNNNQADKGNNCKIF